MSSPKTCLHDSQYGMAIAMRQRSFVMLCILDAVIVLTVLHQRWWLAYTTQPATTSAATTIPTRAPAATGKGLNSRNVKRLSVAATPPAAWIVPTPATTVPNVAMARGTSMAHAQLNIGIIKAPMMAARAKY
ncbi:hypothetical protein H257_17610 [Aphanomyces astaci]|uniref:Uncharacterized protein n=1 Tax=Aphanomyces astaci TaxID=112090 RepID=W4FFS6_APHAT|nr:hypothetical protein H257_17610 [Aphanomyces astaci]ETV65724.1 hypothetical protein H257_17610 [Aphanomyces astaci]|eukprot:XP_009844776.1 hypothetical protein H257_17610 [Aphanomyces astaci]